MKVLIDRHAACSFQLKCQKFHRFRTLHGDHIKVALGSWAGVQPRQPTFRKSSSIVGTKR